MQVGLSATRLNQARAAAGSRKYMLSKPGPQDRVDVIIAKDATDLDLLLAYASALLAAGHVTNSAVSPSNSCRERTIINGSKLEAHYSDDGVSCNNTSLTI